MKREMIFLLLFSTVLFLPAFCSAQSPSNETLTITTYYPSPYGVYRNLKLSPTDAEPSGSALSAGVMYYDNRTGYDVIRYYNKTGQWVNLTGGGGGFDPLQVRRIVVGDVNGDGNINAADIPASSRPVYVQGPSAGINTAAFVNANLYGVAIGGEDGLTYGVIQSDRFLNGVGEDPAVADLVINAIGGNVGIATSSPQQKLDVNGAIRLAPVTVPAVTAEGSMYYDSAQDTLRYRDATQWNNFISEYGAVNLPVGQSYLIVPFRKTYTTAPIVIPVGNQRNTLTDQTVMVFIHDINTASVEFDVDCVDSSYNPSDTCGQVIEVQYIVIPRP